MVQIYLNKIPLGDYQINAEPIWTYITRKTNLLPEDFYLVQNGRLLYDTESIKPHLSVQCVIRSSGGKGGFGSMLRAIGAQIEKTTNREACRDLSGRRLRDINEEKRLKAWLEKQADREREAEERKKKKIEKLLHVPKHEFKDEVYEETRSNLTEKVNDAVTEGLKTATTSGTKAVASDNVRKRKAETSASKNKKKCTLWIDDNISGSDSSSECSDAKEDVTVKRKKIDQQ